MGASFSKSKFEETSETNPEVKSAEKARPPNGEPETAPCSNEGILAGSTTWRYHLHQQLPLKIPQDLVQDRLMFDQVLTHRAEQDYDRNFFLYKWCPVSFIGMGMASGASCARTGIRLGLIFMALPAVQACFEDYSGRRAQIIAARKEHEYARATHQAGWLRGPDGLLGRNGRGM